MAFTNEDWLPSYEELNVPELKMTAAPLKAGSHYLGKYCDTPCKEFMLCHKEEKDPRKCINEGKEVTRCGIEFYQKVKNTCADEFTKYWKCVDKAGQTMEFRYCRKPQAAFDKCMLDKMDMERPELGHFSKVRVHKTNRPKPQINVKFPEPTRPLPEARPEDVPEDIRKLGARNYGSPY